MGVKIKVAKQELLSIKRDTDEQLNILNDKKSELLSIEQNNIYDVKKNQEILNNIKRIEENLKEKEKSISDSNKEIINIKHKLGIAELSIRDRENKLLVEREEFSQKQKALEEDKEKAVDNINKSNEIKQAYGIKLSEVNSLKIKLDSQVFSNKQIEESLDKIKQEQEFVRDELSEQLEKNRKLETSLLKQIEEQNKFSNELRLRELRLEKLARDKGVTEELAKLQKELNGK